MAAQARWSFDFHSYLWAVVPMGADWLYTTASLLGGEAAARLSNFTLLAAVVVLVQGQVRRSLPGPLASLLVAGCAAIVLSAHPDWGPEAVRELIRLGTRFTKVENGETDGSDVELEYDLGQEGGHSHRRVVHALGDATGKEVMRALIAHARSLPNAEFWERTFIIDLLTFDGRCCGAIVWNRGHGKTIIWAKETG